MGKMFRALEKAERDKGLEKEKRISQIDRQEVAQPPRGDSREREILQTLKIAGRSTFGDGLVICTQPGSITAEQFRKLRTRILSHDLDDPLRTIMVTSATETEGKTLVAANLAAAIAFELNYNALLVDTDLRNPSVGEMFGFRQVRGLSDYLVSQENISNFFIKTGIDRLSIIPGGSGQENPAELLGSMKMENLVNELKSRYRDRYIIFDSSPLLATSEPSVLTKMVDGIVLVVRAGVTARETVQQAISHLDSEKILGVILNDVEFKLSALNARYFGSKSYYYRYHREHREKKPEKPWQNYLSFVEEKLSFLKRKDKS
jgi:exopolysaccharide/PEP-CTERM locus tyrosine autokinase